MWWDFDIRQLYATMFATTLAGIIGLLRIIFTSKAQIDQLQKSLKHLEDGREKRDIEIDSQLKEIRHDIKNLLSRR